VTKLSDKDDKDMNLGTPRWDDPLLSNEADRLNLIRCGVERGDKFTVDETRRDWTRIMAIDQTFLNKAKQIINIKSIQRKF
jgi:hypothetical protein